MSRGPEKFSIIWSFTKTSYFEGRLQMLCDPWRAARLARSRCWAARRLPAQSELFKFHPSTYGAMLRSGERHGFFRLIGERTALGDERVNRPRRRDADACRGLTQRCCWHAGAFLRDLTRAASPALWARPRVLGKRGRLPKLSVFLHPVHPSIRQVARRLV